MANSSHTEFEGCLSSTVTKYIFTFWALVYLFFLPVFLFVFYIGFNKWKTPQSSASGGLNHSDVITLNMTSMEMVNIVGSFGALFGYYGLSRMALRVGGNTVLGTVTGQTLFHSLTCVERYLAVVHPVTYLRLKRGGGVIIRNISLGIVWVFSLIYSLLVSHSHTEFTYAISHFVLAITPFPFITYFTVYVLCVLNRPKPGEASRRRGHIDQSKRSTVYIMVAILGALLIRLIVNVACSCIHVLFLGKVDGCVMKALSVWAALPSSLVLPLLFLQRSGSMARKASE